MSRTRKVRKSLNGCGCGCGGCSKSVNGIFTTISPSSNVLADLPNVPEDMDDWGCDLWTTYYKRIKERDGKAKAIEIVTLDAERVGWFANLEWCKGDCNFIKFFKNEGVPTGNLFTDLYCGAGDVISATTGAVVDIAGGVGGVASGAGKTAKFIGQILPVLVVGGAAYAGYRYYKHGRII